MKQAAGYITDDGSFFEKETEAALHEAESRLRGVLAVGFPEVNADKLMAIMFEVRQELGEYINAYAAAYPPISDQSSEVADGGGLDTSGEAEVLGHLGHVSSTEEDLASLLKLPPRGPSHVPDVGRGPRTEKVQERRTEHGPRVRGADAPGVRGRKDMAAKQGPKA